MNAAPPEVLLQSALWYASVGWPVFPVHSLNEDGTCTCGLAHAGRDSNNIAKHPRTSNGFLSATTDPAQIHAWWQQWPTANIGVRLGEPSGLLVLDIDPRNGGDVTLGGYLSQFGPMPDVPEVKTGGGGWHFYFSWPHGTRGTSIEGGIDIKADGGYVLAPPSIHKSGARYEWRRKPRRGEGHVAPPEWVVKEQRAKARAPIRRTTKATEGERHLWMVRMAGGLRRYGFDGDQIYTNLSEQNVLWCDPPLPADEIASIAYSADWNPTDIGLTEPRELNDRGNALRLIDRYGDSLRYAPTHGWFVWSDTHWERSEQMARHLVAEVVSSIKEEIFQFHVEDEKKMVQILKFHTASGQSSRIDGMEKIARSDPRVAVRNDRFDADPWLFNVANGTIDLRTGELHPHQREDLVTKQAPVVYERGADCPLFKAHLEYFLEGNQNVIGYLQRLFGYALTGIVSEGVFPIFWGSGGNGKSTLLRVIRRVMGRDYAQAAPSSFLIAKDMEAHSTETASLEGARLVVASEIERGKRLDVAQMKQYTGEDVIKARFMRQDPFEFPVTFQIIYLTNDMPDIRNHEDATWNRVKLVSFNRAIPLEQRDRGIDFKLAAEYSGVLNWLIEGCLEWQAGGLREPDEVKVDTAVYRRDSDVFEPFEAGVLDFVDGAEITVAALYNTYCDWARHNSEYVFKTQRAFTAMVKGRPGWKERYQNAGSKRFWSGVKVRGV